ncbi:MAG: Rieske 2Fe-2S domain-containing protein [Acidobacteria bacterium]|nr:Rieske 2Fe-2S domain-containing protein [Acidobacteriota bacterium]MBI3265373.1 Rieske 2Fe-2S domain-containing protein [Acidobacteriota bacterium]
MADTPAVKDAIALVGRRRFLDAILGTGFASTAVAVVYPIWRFLIPPPSGEAATASTVAARLADVKSNSGLVFKFGTKPGLLVRTPEGEVRAFSAVCTHLNCTVQYRSDTSQIWCACHNGVYDLAGNVVSGPPPRPLEALTVNVRGAAGQEEIVVSRA